MKMISMKKLRENFDKIKRGLRKGEGYVLLYRSKPLAKIIPYSDEIAKTEDRDYKQHTTSFSLPLADALSPIAYSQVLQSQPVRLMQENQIWAEIIPKKTDNWAGKSKAEKLSYVKKTAGLFTGKSLTPTEMKNAYDKEVYGNLLS